MIHVVCMNCGKTLDIPEQYAGLSGKCNHCGAKLSVPAAQQDQLIRVKAGPTSATTGESDFVRKRQWRPVLFVVASIIIIGSGITELIHRNTRASSSLEKDLPAVSTSSIRNLRTAQGTQITESSFNDKPVETPPPRIGKWEGFRGLKWGTLRHEIPGLIPTDDEFKYTRSTDELKIGDAKLSSITYIFLGEQLAKVDIFSRGYDNHRELLKIFRSQYGDHSIASMMEEVYIWKEHSQLEVDLSTHVIYSFGGDSEIIMITFSYGPFADALREQGFAVQKRNVQKAEEKARKAAEEDL